MSQSDQPSNDTTTARRRWIHPSVWLAALPLVALLVYLNWRGEVLSGHMTFGCGVVPEEPPITIPSSHAMHGWPFTFVERLGVELPEWSLARDVAIVDNRALALDILLAVAILAVFVVASEWRCRRRGSLFRFSMLDLAAATTVLAIGLGWFKYQEHRLARENEIATSLEGQGCHVAMTRDVPALFSRIVGRDISAFDQATIVSFDDGTTDEGVVAAAEDLSQLPAITRVYFGNSPEVTDAGVACIIGSRFLETVDISSTAATGSSLAGLPGDCLFELRAYDSRFDDEGLAALARQSRLESLYLSGTLVSDRGLRHLQHMQSLQELDLSDTALTDAAVDELSNLPSLLFIELPEHISPAALDRLQRVLPEANIDHQ